MMKDQELKAQWVAALRSGEFKQTYGRLKRDDDYCCLGVLCHIGKEKLKMFGYEIEEGDDSLHIVSISGHRNDRDLPLDLRLPLGIDEEQSTLVTMNDGEVAGPLVSDISPRKNRKTFAEIADWIEANL